MGRRSRIVKAHEAQDLNSFSLFDSRSLRSACEAELEAARTAADRIQREAHETAEDAVRLASDEGHRQGLEQAAAELEQRIQEQAHRLQVDRQAELQSRLADLMESLTSEIRQQREQWEMMWERSAIKLAVAIAERIVQCELSRSPEIGQAMIRRSLELISGQQVVCVRLNPNDLAMFGQDADSTIVKLTRNSECMVVADESVSPGGCHVETQFGELDSTRETQLKRIVEELLL